MSPAGVRPGTLPLGNNFDVHIDNAKVSGVLSDGLVFHAIIAKARGDSAPLFGLDVSVPSRGPGTGDYMGTFPGTSLEALRVDYLHKQVWVIATSVPAGSYRDAFPVTVAEDQSA